MCIEFDFGLASVYTRWYRKHDLWPDTVTRKATRLQEFWELAVWRESIWPYFFWLSLLKACIFDQYMSIWNSSILAVILESDFRYVYASDQVVLSHKLPNSLVYYEFIGVCFSEILKTSSLHVSWIHFTSKARIRTSVAPWGCPSASTTCDFSWGDSWGASTFCFDDCVRSPYNNSNIL